MSGNPFNSEIVKNAFEWGERFLKDNMCEEVKAKRILKALDVLTKLSAGDVWTEYHWRLVLQLVQDLGINFLDLDSKGE